MGYCLLVPVFSTAQVQSMLRLILPVNSGIHRSSGGRRSIDRYAARASGRMVSPEYFLSEDCFILYCNRPFIPTTDEHDCLLRWH